MGWREQAIIDSPEGKGDIIEYERVTSWNRSAGGSAPTPYQSLGDEPRWVVFFQFSKTQRKIIFFNEDQKPQKSSRKA